VHESEVPLAVGEGGGVALGFVEAGGYGVQFGVQVAEAAKQVFVGDEVSGDEADGGLGLDARKRCWKRYPATECVFAAFGEEIDGSVVGLAGLL
jgi:hypothetical protein